MLLHNPPLTLYCIYGWSLKEHFLKKNETKRLPLKSGKEHMPGQGIGAKKIWSRASMQHIRETTRSLQNYCDKCVSEEEHASSGVSLELCYTALTHREEDTTLRSENNTPQA